MPSSSLELELVARWREKRPSAVALGIDLGTAQTGTAGASFDATTDRLGRECVRWGHADCCAAGAMNVAVAARSLRISQLGCWPCAADSIVWTTGG